MKFRTNRKSTFISAFALGIVVTISFFAIYSFSNPANENDTNRYLEKNYKIVPPQVPENLTFAGEPVPIKDFDVFERVERELIVNKFWHSSSILWLKRASRWFPVIEPILEKNGVPEDFKYLAMIESNLSNVISPAGATGFWQFLKSTGRRYGLEINGEVDERYHIEKSTKAACDYLKDSYEKYGSWTMAAASYNMGKNGVENQMERQAAKNYWNLILNEETSRYVPRIIAAKELFKDPEKFGFHIPEDTRYKEIPFKYVTVNSRVVDFAAFAKKYGINYKILKEFNPWLRENYLTNRHKKEYKIKIPLEGEVYVVPE